MEIRMDEGTEDVDAWSTGGSAGGSAKGSTGSAGGSAAGAGEDLDIWLGEDNSSRGFLLSSLPPRNPKKPRVEIPGLTLPAAWLTSSRAQEVSSKYAEEQANRSLEAFRHNMFGQGTLQEAFRRQRANLMVQLPEKPQKSVLTTVRELLERQNNLFKEEHPYHPPPPPSDPKLIVEHKKPWYTLQQPILVAITLYSNEWPLGNIRLTVTSADRTWNFQPPVVDDLPPQDSLTWLQFAPAGTVQLDAYCKFAVKDPKFIPAEIRCSKNYKYAKGALQHTLKVVFASDDEVCDLRFGRRFG